jgi:hypothetical protein
MVCKFHNGFFLAKTSRFFPREKNEKGSKDNHLPITNSDVRLGRGGLHP